MHARIKVKYVHARNLNFPSLGYKMLTGVKKVSKFWVYGAHPKKVFLKVPLAWVGPYK